MKFVPAAAVVAFFKYKIVSSIIVLACGNEFEQLHLVREFSRHGMRATVACNPAVLDNVHSRLQGVLQLNDTLLDQVKLEHFAIWNKWLVVGDEIPAQLHGARYDADVALLRPPKTEVAINGAMSMTSVATHEPLYFEDIYVHLRDGASLHPWATWTSAAGLQLTHERARLLRRLDLKRYPMRIATPIGHYEEAGYDGNFAQYVLDNSMPERDSAIRCGYGASTLILEALKAEEQIVQVQLWTTEVSNSTSMMTKVAGGTSELSGTTLRVLPNRIARLDYVMPIWPFIVGFTYLSERESSSNMFVMPFSGAVWGACLVVALVLALAQRAAAKAPVERDGAFVAVLATWLQQAKEWNSLLAGLFPEHYNLDLFKSRVNRYYLDKHAPSSPHHHLPSDASAVPEGASGRLTFMVLSVCSMLVYAYYTSAVVSALMSAGGGGPDSLRALADSRYAIASEDYDWIRYQMFDVETTWEELEYLKRKKMTSSIYQTTERGMQLVQEGNTAFHAEYNHIYPLMKIFSDQQICKLQYVHTVPEIMSWVVTAKRGQWTDVLRSAGGWVHETGLAKRLVSRVQVKPPACRAALLAERVKYGDVAPLIVLTAVGFMTSVALLFVEIFVAKWNPKSGRSAGNETSIMDEELIG